MPAYRFVLFPRGVQPTEDEVAALTALAPQLGGHIAWGTDSKTGGLAAAFDADPFERTLAASFELQALLHRWQAQGAHVEPTAKFVKDSAALRPAVRPNYSPGIHPEALQHIPAADRLLTAKQNLAHDAVARARIAFDRALARHESLRRFAVAAPYLVIAAGTIGLLIAGWYVGDRLLNSGRERRSDTIERVAEDPLAEAIDDHE